MVQNFSKDADVNLKDSFEDPDYCPKEDSGNKVKVMQEMYKFRISLDHHMKTKYVGNWPCKLCQCRFKYSTLLKEHYKKIILIGKKKGGIPNYQVLLQQHDLK